MKLDFFKKEKHFKKENYQINKNIYWNILLSVFFISIIGIMFFGFFIFNKMNLNGGAVSENTTKTDEENRKAKIGSVLEYFKEKETNSAQILNNPSGIIDPSL